MAVDEDPQSPSVEASPDRVSAPSGTEYGLSFLPPEQRRALETFSANLARAAWTAQSAVTAAAVAPDRKPDPDPLHVGDAVKAVVERLAATPDALAKAQTDLFTRYSELWRAASQRAQGAPVDPVASPAPGDKRFKDEAWSSDPTFDVMKQSYLIASEWLNGLVAQVDGVDAMTKKRVAFSTKLLTDAFSPSNFLFSNPVALREAMASQGESLVRGAEAFAADMVRGGGKLAIRQTDTEHFKVGENVATSPGKVVFQNELFQLIQYNPSTDEVYKTPLLIFPPWINKFYILDLKPQNSMIRWLTRQGFTVFLTSWVNPTPALSGRTLYDYMTQGAYTAIAQVMAQCGVMQVNTVGYCIGGTLLGCTLAHMAARELPAIASATFFAAQQDFTEAGDLLMFSNDAWLEEVETQMEACGGVLPGAAMADTFNLLRANDLIWSFYVNNYLMGKEPAAFDLLFWNSDQTRMPKTLHLNYLRDFYQANRLSKGDLTLGGVKLDLGQVTTPIYVQSSREDHIAPMRSVYRGARLFGGPVVFTLSGSGHIAGVINHPDANKYQHWTNPELPGTVEEWLEGAVETKGSWWPHWAAWLGERSGEMVAARDPAAGVLPVIEDAPGSYVKVRSGDTHAA